MNKRALVLLASLAIPGFAAAAEPSPVSGNISIVSDYRFRGISQTYLGPAIQGGLDFAHRSGFYLGNWNSNISSQVYTGGSGIEMDFYGGWKKSFGEFGIDLGTIYYWYPKAEWNSSTGSSTGDAGFDNWEVYAGASWKWLSAKVFYALSDYFGLADEQAGSYYTHKDTGAALGGRGGSDGTWYLDLAASVPLTKQLSVIAHYGMLEVEKYSELNYKDWKLGVTYDLDGWLLGAAYVDTDADESWYYCCAGGSRGVKETGKSTVVFSIQKTF
jgi:uncharacterized protein (TIGR02001 family)